MEKCEEVLLNVIKNIFCSEKYSENCNKCSLCHLIDNKSLPTLKMIEPDGNFIKKEQIIELINDFSTYSQITDKKVYIIKNSERLNKESANTMLKFLEEPSSDIIGFFITNNSNNVIETIQSRCQLIDAIFDNNIEDNLGLSSEKFKEYQELAIDYINSFEKDKKDLILINSRINEFDKQDIISLFQIMLDIYQKALTKDQSLLDDYSKLSYLKDFKQGNIIKKNKLIMEFLRKINYNVNVDLLLDSFVLEMDGINNENI